MNSGIYFILNLSSGRHYVGSTVNLSERWKRHKRDLQAERHHNQKLQRAWLKHGEGAFRYDIVETCPIDELSVREQFWLDNTRPYYNVLRRAYSCAGFAHTDQAKQKMSAAAKRVLASQSEEQKARRRAKQAASITGRKHSAETRARMSRAHATKRPSVRQLQNLANGRTEAAYKKRAESRAKHYIVISPDGVEMRIKNLCDFCRRQNLSQAHMNAIAKGSRAIHKGWKCRYDEPIQAPE